ncbi:MAG TPA: hypothetical protein VMU39_27510 [Solirubrobacteraceae bacterium]|nr:hypothetical protein [Solirubrobacteraceae bacterium]
MDQKKEQGNIRIVDADPTTGLPPAGDARTDELKRRADALAEQADTHGLTQERANPKAFEEDREILQYIAGEVNQLEVQNAQPGYRYVWVCDKRNYEQVQLKLTERVREKSSGAIVPVWEPVKGSDFKEAPECIDVQGWRRIGDTVLLRAREERAQAMDAYHEDLKRRQRGQYESNLLDAEEKWRRRGGGVQVHLNSPMADPSLRSAAMQAARAGVGRDEFYKQVDQKLREGAGR